MYKRWKLSAAMVSLILIGAAIVALPEEQSAEAQLLKRLGLSPYLSFTTPPHFSGKDLNDSEVSGNQLKGRVILMTFWASWCIECRNELPQLEQLHREFEKSGLSVIGMNARESKPTIVRYVKELHLTFPIIADSDGDISSDYGVIGLPTTFLIRRNGSAAGLAIGSRNWDNPNARNLIKSLLGQPIGTGRN